MKKRRVFIAINLPQKVKKRLFEFSEKHKDLPVRWIAEDNLHITLLFIGYATDEETAKICKLVKEIVSKHAKFKSNLAKIDYDSERKLPRMIWVFGEENKPFAELEEDLRNGLRENRIGFDDRHRDSLIHITLGRITRSEWSGTGKPNIAENFPPEADPTAGRRAENLEFPVETVEVMEGAMTKKGREYVVLESAKLK